MQNRFHKYINLPFEIVKPEECNTFWDYANHIPVEQSHSSAAPVIEWLNRYNVDSVDVEIFYTPPNGGTIPPHTDSPSFNDQTKINVTWGPDIGETRWWTSNKWYEFSYAGEETAEDHKGKTHKDLKVLRADEENCELIYSANTNRPSLINVGQLHSTYNPGEVGRHTLCFNLIHLGGSKSNPLVWDEAIEVFKDILE